MKVFAETEINGEDLELHIEIRNALHELEDKEEVLTCHILARAVAEVWNLTCVDGKFLNLMEHSWTKTASGNIIDVYPVGIVGGPLLVDGSMSMFVRRLYQELPDGGYSQYSPMLQSQKFLMLVNLTIKQLESIKAKTAT